MPEEEKMSPEIFTEGEVWQENSAADPRRARGQSQQRVEERTADSRFSQMGSSRRCQGRLGPLSSHRPRRLCQHRRGNPLADRLRHLLRADGGWVVAVGLQVEGDRSALANHIGDRSFQPVGRFRLAKMQKHQYAGEVSPARSNQKRQLPTVKTALLTE